MAETAAFGTVAFGVVAFALLVSALRVVTSRDLVHTVLWLGVTLSATAAAFLMLRAPFLATIQLLLYTGGVLTLMLFGIMLTRRPDAGAGQVPNRQTARGRGIVFAGSLFGLMAAAVHRSDLPQGLGDRDPIGAEAIGRAFLTTHLLAFEVLSVLLLAVVVGAIVLTRRADPASGGEDRPRLPPRRRSIP